MAQAAPLDGRCRHEHIGVSKVCGAIPIRNETSELLFEVVRYEPNAFKQRRPGGKGGWIWNLDGVWTVLYRLKDLLAADPSATIYIVEGEKTST
jgi:hypothetical protein